MAVARGRRQPGSAADHVRHRRRAAADRMDRRLAAGLREIRAGAHRQCGAYPAPTRRVRRDHGHLSSGAARRADDRRIRMGRRSSSFSSISRKSGASRTRASGKCADRRSISPIPRSWPGSRSIARSRARKPSGSKGRSTTGASCATRFAKRSATRGFDTEARHLRAGLRIGPARRQPAAVAVRRLPAGDRSAHRKHDRGDRTAACCATASSCATAPRRSKTHCRRARARSSPAASGWSTFIFCRSVSTKPSGCSGGWSGLPTMSAC